MGYESKLYAVILSACDASTHLLMELSPSEEDFLKWLSEETEKARSSNCMPVIRVRVATQYDEDDRVEKEEQWK